MKKLMMLCMLSSMLFASNVHDGVAALKDGDYESAMANFTYAANSGDKIAQQNLGVMYHSGIGIAQDREKAAHWFNIASKNSKNSGHSSSCVCSR